MLGGVPEPPPKSSERSVLVSDTTSPSAESRLPEASAVAPAPDAPAARRADGTWKFAAVVLAAVIVIVAVAGWYVADQRWSRRAMVATGLSGVEALITGDGAKLAALSDAAVRAQLTPQLVASMKAAATAASFAVPQWKGDVAGAAARTAAGEGMLLVGPSPDGTSVVVFQTTGALGNTDGALSLVRDWSGWVITGLTAGVTPAATSSVSPTATTPATPAVP
jgi:hypothetical protein